MDNINHPSHYETAGVECIEAMELTQGREAVKNFCLCNAYKYLWRHKNKNGLEDIKKARWYLDRYITMQEGVIADTVDELREKGGKPDWCPMVEAEIDKTELVKDWISVRDRLPRLGQQVMAFCRAGIRMLLRYDGELWFEMSSRKEYLYSFVTHWQPLPAAPKGE